MRVLLTGGSGFIGDHVARALTAHGDEVVVLDRDAPAGGAAIRADVGDLDAVTRAVTGVDAVCHQAAKVGLGVDFADAPDYVRDNDLGTAVLLRALHDVGFAGPFVLASSMVVYGEGRYRCATHAIVPAPPRRPPDLAAGRYEPACPHCGAPLVPEPVPETAPARPPQRLRGVEARAGAPRVGVRS